MAVTLNDTLGVKRDIKHYDFGMPFWEATRQKKLIIQYCKTAKKYQHCRFFCNQSSEFQFLIVHRAQSNVGNRISNFQGGGDGFGLRQRGAK